MSFFTHIIIFMILNEAHVMKVCCSPIACRDIAQFLLISLLRPWLHFCIVSG